MKKELLAVFSGFPEHHFSEEITKRLRRELTVRKSIVFITACPLDYAQNAISNSNLKSQIATSSFLTKQIIYSKIKTTVLSFLF